MQNLTLIEQCDGKLHFCDFGKNETQQVLGLLVFLFLYARNKIPSEFFGEPFQFLHKFVLTSFRPGFGNPYLGQRGAEKTHLENQHRGV
jgi:hypothetical protein